MASQTSPASPRNITLRLKTKDGPKTLATLTGQSDLAALCQAIAAATQTQPGDLRLLVGFPPTLVDLDRPTLTLAEARIHHGDTIVVEKSPAAVAAAAAASRCHADACLAAQLNSLHRPGVLVRRVVDADNSCLFSSFNLVMRITGSTTSFQTRELIARVVHSDPAQYNAGFLGRDNAAYCAWILNETSWGGAIEISILSTWYGVEVCVVDTQTARINRFGEDRNYDQRVLVIYDGIHYDALVYEEFTGEETTKFSIEDQPSILMDALDLAMEAKSSRQYTDIKNLTLKCLICDKGLTSKTASEHAKLTGHNKFGEI